MSSNKSNSTGRNKILVPDVSEAMEQFKMEAANDLDVTHPY